MTDWSDPWNDPTVAAEQCALIDRQLAYKDDWPRHFQALVEAVRSTNCPGEILEVGCGSGASKTILDKSGVRYRDLVGIDVSKAAIDIARERYPSESWGVTSLHEYTGTPPVHSTKRDIVIDGSALLHVEDWQRHLTELCCESRRWVILHRVPSTFGTTHRTDTTGYGKTFPAWRFSRQDIEVEMESNGFMLTSAVPADGYSETLVFAKPRHWATYCDRAYLPRLKVLYESMKQHCGPFMLYVLAWDEEVAQDAGFAWDEDVHYRSAFDGQPLSFLEYYHELRPENLPGPPRTKIEHYWTCGPEWIADVMMTEEPVTYVDADIMFHSSPEPMFAEIGGAPAAFIPHNFAPASAGLPGPTIESHAEPFGLYNVGICHFAEPKVVADWAERCRRWCYDKPVRAPNGEVWYGDQKYLEYLARDHGAHIVQNPAAAPGPWCVHTQKLESVEGRIMFGGRSLIAWHYSGLRELPDGHSINTRPEYGLTDEQARILYVPYWEALDKAKTG